MSGRLIWPHTVSGLPCGLLQADYRSHPLVNHLLVLHEQPTQAASASICITEVW